LTPFWSRCMLELNFTIYRRAANLSSVSSVDVCSIAWRITDQASVQTLSQQWMTKPLPVSEVPCTLTVFLIQRSWLIIMFCCLVLSAHVYNWRKWCSKWSHSSSVTGLNRLVRLQSCDKGMSWCTARCKMMLFCANHCTSPSLFHNLEVSQGSSNRSQKNCWSWKHLKMNGMLS